MAGPTGRPRTEIVDVTKFRTLQKSPSVHAIHACAIPDVLSKSTDGLSKSTNSIPRARTAYACTRAGIRTFRKYDRTFGEYDWGPNRTFQEYDLGSNRTFQEYDRAKFSFAKIVYQTG